MIFQRRNLIARLMEAVSSSLAKSIPTIHTTFTHRAIASLASLLSDRDDGHDGRHALSSDEGE